MKLLPICFALLLSSPVNAQLDKEFEKQEREKSEKFNVCAKLFDKAQYENSDGDVRYYIDNNNVTLIVKPKNFPEACVSGLKGTLNNQSSVFLIKVEDSNLVSYYKFGSEVRRRVLGTKR